MLTAFDNDHFKDALCDLDIPRAVCGVDANMTVSVSRFRPSVESDSTTDLHNKKPRKQSALRLAKLMS